MLPRPRHEALIVKQKATNRTVHDIVVCSVLPTYLSIALCIALWPAACNELATPYSCSLKSYVLVSFPMASYATDSSCSVVFRFS